jgi:hypothetical protein
MVSILTALAWLAGVAHPARAHAQQAEQYPVVILGEDSAAEFSIRDGTGRTLVNRCYEPCSVMLARGRVRLEMFDAEGSELGARNVKVNREARWTALPHDPTKRDVGLGLGISGALLLSIGSILWLTNTTWHGDSDETDGERMRAGVGALMTLGGAIMTPIGLPMFFGNLRPKVAVRSLDQAD